MQQSSLNSLKFNSLKEWLEFLERSHGESNIELGLDRVNRVYQRLNLPKIATQVITVAGTNGKGSCIKALESLLLAAGKQIGCYTSPHILHFNERVTVNGKMIDDEPLCSAFAQVKAAQQEDTDQAITLTYFEIVTLAAFIIFAQKQLDYVLLEVGLGGRLDAVNIVDADIAVITSIDLDHQGFLGDTLEAIAGEKAGILRKDAYFVCGQTSQQLVLKAIAGDLVCDAFYAGTDFSSLSSKQAQNLAWQGINSDKETVNYALTKLQLPPNSVACALQVFALLNIELSQESVANALAKAQLAGRYQKLVHQGREVIIDVAHNPASVALLAEQLSAEETRQTHAVFSMLIDKDLESSLALMREHIDAWFVAPINHPRARSKVMLEDVFNAQQLNYTSSNSLGDAFTAALGNSKENDRIVLFGSFYLLAELFNQQTGLLTLK